MTVNVRKDKELLHTRSKQRYRYNTGNNNTSKLDDKLREFILFFSDGELHTAGEFCKQLNKTYGHYERMRDKAKYAISTMGVDV
jgi:hypothetical protein